MPRKSSTAPAFTPPTDEEGVLVLQGELLWKWRALDAEMRHAGLAVQEKQREIDDEVAKHETLKTLIGDKHGLVRAHSQAQIEMKALLGEMEKQLGISMERVSIDDKTGRVYVLDDAGQAIPQKPKGKKRPKAAKK